MAYMRGEYYLWDDESGLHLWAARGYDYWDESGWHRDDDGQIYEGHLSNRENTASGVSIPQEVIDEYVVMRLAQLVYEGNLVQAIDRAITPRGYNGNIGGMMLEKNADKLKAALANVHLDSAPPYSWPQGETGGEAG